MQNTFLLPMKRFLLLLPILLLTACGASGSLLREATLVSDLAAASPAAYTNPYDSLSVPTCVTKVGDLYFIVDCYHNQVLCHDNLTDPVSDFSVLPDVSLSAFQAAAKGEAVQGAATKDGIKQPHTIASDGVVYLVDDTENNRVLIYEKKAVTSTGSVTEAGFLLTQTFDRIGVRPHFTVYDEATKTFYVWSSFSGELFLFQRRNSDNRVLLLNVLTVPELAGVYVRSFTITDNSILFVSGLPVPDSVYTQAKEASSPSDDTSLPQAPTLLPMEERATGVILRCDKKTLAVRERYAVPDALAGMVQIMPVSSGYLITVSTDLSGNADAATMVRCSDLAALAKGDYEELYDTCFLGGGTPYYMGTFDGHCYLTEHRLPGHAVWQFDAGEDITDVTALY